MMNSVKAKIVLVWVIALTLVGLFIAMIVIRIDNAKVYDEYKDIETSQYLIKDITGKKDSSYYVFIYSSKDDSYKKQELEKCITTYFTYVHQNKDNDTIVPIYLYNTDNYKAKNGYKTCADYLASLNSSISYQSLPMLVLVSDGAVDSVYSTIGGSSGIEATLSAAIQ